jgi:peptide/nickel transport system permease protein
MTAQAPDQAAVLAAAPSVTGPARNAAGKSRWRRANLALWFPAGLLVLLVVACFGLPLCGVLADPMAGDLTATIRPPFSAGHLLGTDTIGRDVLARLLYGGRNSIEIAAAVNVLGIVVGGFIGALAAVKRGLLEATIMRVLEVMMAFPALVLTIVIATYLGPSIVNVIWAISFFAIPAYARLARAETLKLREYVFVDAARLGGCKDLTILLRHITPNVLPQLLTYSLLQAGLVVVIEATLSFLGAGLPPAEPSWGSMISVGQIYLSSHPALVLIPSAAVFLTVISLNLVGDALRARIGRPR